MSEQLDRSEGRYYAIERLSQLQKEIIHLLQGMVIPVSYTHLDAADD